MLNLLSYLGMNLQSEVCLWTLLGLLRTIFDATLFKVNANLKQVWQMTMPSELSMHVQRALRTMISSVMLVQCFTVYVYLATYIVLLYPVFLEERPALVLPWLLLAAIRKLLCELLSLAMGLGVCVLLGPARPPCIKFVVMKIASIIPFFYMWMLVLSYYQALKITSAFKSFSGQLPSSDHDFGLELAVRRRLTKSLQDEESLRKKLVASLYGERNISIDGDTNIFNSERATAEIKSEDSSGINLNQSNEIGTSFQSENSHRLLSDTGMFEDWFGSEVIVPRDADRILEQFILMMLRIGLCIQKEGTSTVKLNSTSLPVLPQERIITASSIADMWPDVSNAKMEITGYANGKRSQIISQSTEAESHEGTIKNHDIQAMSAQEKNSKLSTVSRASFSDRVVSFEIKDSDLGESNLENKHTESQEEQENILNLDDLPNVENNSSSKGTMNNTKTGNDTGPSD